MNVEQRLIQAFDDLHHVEASTDLWSRVVHSIEEDRRHRRNVANTTAFVLAACVAFGLAMWIGLVDDPAGRHVGWKTMEVIETTLLVAIVVTLAPAIRRFGRGFADDLWPAVPTIAPALLRLLDIAYALVAGGYILLTVQLDADLQSSNLLAGQLADTSGRVAGLVLLIGMLHAVTIGALPLLALVSNSTRMNTTLPRWIVWLLVACGIAVGFFLMNLIGGLIAIGAS